ncbi:hypothetical protein ACFX1X_028720 [Malus domestica]|nr:transcription termination factor MTERF6, chloroplastic/mitochondrial-like [Malus domestica]
MMQLYNLKTLRLVGSVFSCAFASKPKRFVLADPKPSKLCLPNQMLCRPFTSEISETHQDFKVNYLKNTCGLSPEGAISVSKRVKLESPKKADSVLALVRNHGLSQTQISKVVRSRPQILSANLEKILLPKLEFFSSLGVSRVDLAKTLAYNPHLLAISLANRIMPTYDFLRSILSEKNVVALFKRYSRIFTETRFKNVIPNIELLRESGMRPRGISLVLTYCTPV